MKFFTREWVNGEMADEATNSIVPSYFQHIETLHLPQSIKDLANLNTHDGYILDVKHVPTTATLRMRIRCGDLQVGYFDVKVTFLGATISLDHLATLVRAKRPAKTEILYDEVDREGGVYEYRQLLYPEREVSIGFSDVQVVRIPKPNRLVD